MTVISQQRALLSLLPLGAWSTTAQQAQQQQQEPRYRAEVVHKSSSSSSIILLHPQCGDSCWCVPWGGVNEGVCPDSTTAGVRQYFPAEWSFILKSFRLKESSIMPALNSMQSGDPYCYPFADAVGDSEAELLYAAAKYPQCMRFVSSPDTVCAYQYNNAIATTCMNREYEMITYESKQEAQLDNAVVIHKGACGVCSSAQDLSVRMANNAIEHLCSATDFSGESLEELFNNLIECYSRIGFTDSCSALWAHWGTTNEALCSSTCLTEAQEHFGIDDVSAEEISMVPSNGAPPFCFLSECQSCSFNMLEEDFDTLSGIWKSPRNAGMLDNIARDCHSFYPIENHDPCHGMAVEMLDFTSENDPPLVLTIDSESAPSPRTSETISPPIPTPLVITIDSESVPSPSSRLSVGSSFRTIDSPSRSPAEVKQQNSNTPAPIPTPLVLTIDLATEPSPRPSSRLSVGSTFFRPIDSPAISPADVHEQQSSTPAPTPPLVLTIDFPMKYPVDDVHQQQSNTPAPTPPLVLTIDFPVEATGAAAASASAPASSQSAALSSSRKPGDSEFSRASMATFHPLLAIGTIASSVILLA